VGQHSFLVYRPCYHRCPWCGRRQCVIPPFKRLDTSHTYRFELHVLRRLIGTNEEEVARRLPVSADTVARIVRNQLADAKEKAVDPARAVTSMGIDELSLKKRDHLYVTILTDLSDPDRGPTGPWWTASTWPRSSTKSSTASGKRRGGLEAQVLGRSRGGFSTKVHGVVSGVGLRVKFVLTPGQPADAPAAAGVRGTPVDPAVHERRRPGERSGCRGPGALAT
jgi:hypothetical protein